MAGKQGKGWQWTKRRRRIRDVIEAYGADRARAEFKAAFEAAAKADNWTRAELAAALASAFRDVEDVASRLERIGIAGRVAREPEAILELPDVKRGAR